MQTAFDKKRRLEVSKEISVLLLLSISLFACTTPYQAPMAEVGTTQSGLRIRNAGTQTDGSYRVNRGDTLYSIAFQFDLNYSELANANGISNPYIIYPGQVLNLNTSNNRAATTSSTTAINNRTANNRTANNRTTQTQRTTTKPATITTKVTDNPPIQTKTRLSWAWPSKGAVINKFSTTEAENKGIDIEGKTGDEVLAAEAGEVVYAGSGLLRYGDLLIIKHNSQYLSAYAHNSQLLVTEGDKVTRGQKIAALGSTGIDKEMLHFEIRNNGKPVDPIVFLPSR